MKTKKTHGAIKAKTIWFFTPPEDRIPEHIQGTPKEAGWLHYEKNKIARRVMERKRVFSEKDRRKKAYRKKVRKDNKDYAKSRE